MEGEIRDLVRGGQNLRKDTGFEVSDRIKLTVSGDSHLKDTFELFSDYLSDETLAVQCIWSESMPDSCTDVKVEDGIWKIAIAKA